MLFVPAAPCSAWAKLIIHSQAAVDIKVIAYESLTETFIFQGKLQPGDKREIDTRYHGLALLFFDGGQSYPVIIGKNLFTVNITGPAEPPAFSDSAENESLYKALIDNTQVPKLYPFASLMIQAKQLLESSHSIHTVKELTTRKKEFHKFVAENYQSLRHSDMIRRLIAQYFMMHEYVDYHIKGAPAVDIKIQYQKAVLNGVGSWLAILKTHIPEHEILNYCVSLYYNRGMVTLASLLIENFKDVAYCPGDEKQTFSFPEDLLITGGNGNREMQLNKFKGNKMISFVSDDCPVSMVETIIKARQLADRKKYVIVIPLQELSGKHLAMRRMVRSGNIFFVNDEKWRKDNLSKKIKLPLFVQVKDWSNPQNSRHLSGNPQPLK